MDLDSDRPGDAVAWLRKEFPLGSFWYVPTWDGQKSGTIWCAWYKGKNYQADSPGHLAEYISDQIPEDATVVSFPAGRSRPGQPG